MEIIEFLLICASCFVLLRLKTDSVSVYLGILSADIIVSFVVMTVFAKSFLSGILFFANLLIMPWVVFYCLGKNVSASCKKESAGLFSWRDFFSGR